MRGKSYAAGKQDAFHQARVFIKSGRCYNLCALNMWLLRKIGVQTPRAKTFNLGASIQRSYDVAKLKRLQRKYAHSQDAVAALKEFETWIRGEVARTKKRPGGLG